MQERPRRQISPALLAGGLILLIVLAAVATLAFTGGGKKPRTETQAPRQEVDPFEGLGPDPLRGN